MTAISRTTHDPKSISIQRTKTRGYDLNAFHPIPKCDEAWSVMEMIAFQNGPCPIARCFLPHVKANFAARPFGWRHQLPNCIDDRRDLIIMFADSLLQLGEFASEFAVGLQGLAQLHERPHDRDVYLHRAFAFQHAG